MKLEGCCDFCGGYGGIDTILVDWTGNMAFCGRECLLRWLAEDNMDMFTAAAAETVVREAMKRNG